MITCRTTIERKAVVYTVERADGIIWMQIVKFGRKAANRAGGAHFQMAAEEQERQASLAMGPDERVEEVTTRA
jgi:hypothetical protein